jgi:hypothetical protein
VDDYPRNLGEFEARFSTEAACREYLVRLRWPGPTTRYRGYLSEVNTPFINIHQLNLNFGRLRERGWRIILRSPRLTAFKPRRRPVGHFNTELLGVTSPANRMTEKKPWFHHFLLLRTFARVPAGAFFFNLI